jgi:hypothetical protein
VAERGRGGGARQESGGTWAARYSGAGRGRAGRGWAGRGGAAPQGVYNMIRNITETKN